MASLEAQTGTWIAPTNGSWSAAANWQGGFVPDGVQQVADFTGVNLGSFVTVTLDGPRTVGSLWADDKTTASHSWIFSPAVADPTAVLTLDNGGSRPVFSIKNNLATPYYARVRFPLAGTQGLVKNQGLGTLWLDADNTALSGGVRVEQGALRVTQPQALGTDPITLQLVGAANVNSNWLRLELGPDLTVPASPANLVISNPINVGPFTGPSVGAIAAVDTTQNRVTRLTGSITVTGNGGAGGLFTGPTVKGSRLEVTGPVLANDVNAGTQTIDAGHVRLAGGGSVLNWRNNGFLSLGADNGLSGAGGVTLQNAYSRSATFDLNGYDLTLASLSRVGRSSVINGNSADTSILTLDASTSNFSYSDSLSGNLSVVKKGTGTFTLSSSTSNLNNAITAAGSPTINLQDGDTLGLAPGQELLGVPVGTTTTIGSKTATVSSSLGLKVGMSVSGANVASGTKITAISGSTITLSVAATVTGSVITHNFSPLPAGAKIVSINDSSSLTASASALVSSLETVDNVDVVTPFSFQVASHHAYTGRTVLNGGIYSISTISNPLEPGGLGAVPTVGPEYLVFEGGTLRYTGVDGATSRGFTIRDSVNANINVSTSTTTLVFAGDSPASTGGLTKTGPGRLDLSGDHLYEGPTTVAAGTLELSVGGSLSLASSVTVQDSATFVAVGSVGPVLVADGGTLEVGPRSSALLSTSDTLPTLSVARLTVKPEATLEFEFLNGATHDRLAVTEPGGLDIQGGSLGVYANGGYNSFSGVGEFPIIDYVGSFSGSLSSVVLLGTAPDFTYRLVDRPATTDIAVVIAAITKRTWSLSGGGSWITASNWGGNLPDTFGEAAVLGASITAPATVTLDSAATVSGLTFSSSRAYTVSGAGSLAFDAGSAPVDVKTATSAGSHLLDVPVSFTGPARFSTIANSTITFGKDITSSSSADLSGLGTIAFGGQAGFSSITVNGGTLQIGAGGTSGAVTAPEITLASGAKVSLKRSDDFVFSTNIKGSGGSLIHEGTGTTTLTGTDNSYSSLILRSGTVRLGSASAVPGVAGVMAASLTMDTTVTPPATGTLDLNGVNLELGGLWSGTGGILTDKSSTPGTTVFTYGSGSTSTYKGEINDGPQRQVALVKTQSSSLTLDGVGTYSGGTTLRNGTINASKSTSLGLGSTTIALQGVVGTNNFTRLVLAGNVTLTTPLALHSFYANGGAVVSLSSSATAPAKIAGPISVGLATTNGYTFYGGTTTSRYLDLSGAIAAPGLTLVSGESVRFSDTTGGSTFTGLEHRRGTLLIGADNALPTNLQLSLGSLNSATFDLAGHNQTLAQAVRASTNYTATITNSVTASPATLTLNPVSAYSYSGTFTGALSLVKASGSADITLSGVNTHTNPTVIQSGTLLVTGAGRISSSLVDLRNDSTLRFSAITGATSIALGAGLVGSGTVDASGLGLTLAKVFEPADLTITAQSVSLNASTVTHYDIGSTYVYDQLDVTGSMGNAGSMTITVGPGVNRSTNRSFTLATASGGITPGFSGVKVNNVAFTEVGTSGVWNGTVLDSSNGHSYGYSYSETTGVLTVTSGDSTSAFDDWLAANVPNPADRTLDSDPDHDGLSNLLEYATGGDPMVAGTLSVSLGRSGDHLTLTYNRRADDALIYTVEGADDLGGSWTTVIPPSGSANPLAGLANDTVTVVDSASLSLVSRRFLRLKVDYNAP